MQKMLIPSNWAMTLLITSKLYIRPLVSIVNLSALLSIVMFGLFLLDRLRKSGNVYGYAIDCEENQISDKGENVIICKVGL
jgi:hypothetical protein